MLIKAVQTGETLKVVDGKLSTGTPSKMDKFKAFFNKGDYAQSKVADYINAHKKDIMKEAMDLYKAGGKISLIQEQIDKVFTSAGMEGEGPDVFGNIYSNWMGSLSQDLKDKPVHDLFIPGTHDSVANNFDFSKAIHTGDDSSGFLALNKVFSYIPFIGNHTVGDWGITQTMTIKEQLEHGIRAFDIRVAHDHKTGELLVSHTFTAGTFEDTMKQFKEFMDEHPTEVVMLQISKDPVKSSPDIGKKSSDAYKDFIEIIDKYLGDKLVPKDDLDITLQKAIDTQKTAVVSLSGIPGNETLNTNVVKNYWENQQTVEGAVGRADDKYSHPEKFNNAAPFQFSAFTMTPNNKMIIDNLKHGGPLLEPWGLKDTSAELNSHFKEFLEKHPDAGDYVTGFIFDHPSNELIETVIQHNMADH